MTRHDLKPPIRRTLADAPETGHNRWHPDLPPALVVDPGDEVVVDCRDGLDGQITAASLDADITAIDFRRGHPLTGPIAVRGAQPGDVLKVEILAVETDSFGSTAVIPGFGLLGDLFEEPYLVTWGLHDGVATSGRLEGVRIPADPFVGVIGVAPSHERLEQFRAREAAIADAGGSALPPEAGGAVPAGEPYASSGLRTIPPRETGGNLDVPQARAGATVFLPVDVPGALLSLGDVHFAQGDGEVCGTAIECSMTAVIQIIHHPARAMTGPLRDLDYPLIETDDEWVIMGFSYPDYLKELGDSAQSEIYKRSSIDAALRDAFRKARRFLMTAKALSEDEAISLLSVGVDFGVTQVANGNWGAHAIIRKAMFAG
jgi:formamidase